VRRLVLSQGLRLAVAGLAGGVALAVAGTRLLQGMLHGVEPLDQATFAAAMLVVLSLAVAAALIPAIGAARVDPAEALKVE
jgi:putative ABC transport system permease protein